MLPLSHTTTEVSQGCLLTFCCGFLQWSFCHKVLWSNLKNCQKILHYFGGVVWKWCAITVVFAGSDDIWFRATWWAVWKYYHAYLQTPSSLVILWKILRCICDQHTHTNYLCTRKPDMLMLMILYRMVFLKSFNVFSFCAFFCVKFGHWYLLLLWTVWFSVILHSVFWYLLLCHFKHCGCISNKYLSVYLSVVYVRVFQWRYAQMQCWK